MKRASGSRCATLAWLGAVLVPSLASAQTGPVAFSITHQYVSYRSFILGNGVEADTGAVDSHSTTLALDYAVNDRLSLNLSVPFVARRYRGPYPHGVEGVDVPAGTPFLDDGSYQADWQDIRLTASYRTGWGERLVGGPSIEVEAPVGDYPIYGSAAVGKGLWRVGIGATLGAQWEGSNTYWSASYAYVISEEVDNVDLDHHRFSAELGRFLSAAWSGRVFVVGKRGGGLDFFCDVVGRTPQFDRCDEDDYPSFTDRRWYHHDQTMSGEFVNVGMGIDWAASDAHQLTLSWMTGVWERNGYATEHAVTLGWTRYF